MAKENHKIDSLKFIKSEEGKRYFSNISELQQHRFNHALDSELLARIQFGNDFEILSSNLLEWQNKIDKKDKRYSVLSAMTSALLRMYFYTNNLETIIKTAISEYQNYREKNNRLLTENAELTQQVNVLKKQVEYYEQN